MTRVFASVFLLGSSLSALAQGYGNPPPPYYAQDMACRCQAAAETGYVTPGQAARSTQAQGAVTGLLGGAALGALLGGRYAGRGAAVGAGTGFLAGSAIGSS